MRYPGAIWIGPTVNQTPFGMIDVHGLVDHVQMGTEAGSESWFNNPDAQASSHFMNPKSGQMKQLVDTHDKAWAEAAGNAHWFSCENEGNGEPLTESQVSNLIGLFNWIHQNYNIPYQLTDDPNGQGLGWHGMGGAAWGGHYDCPGNNIKAQHPRIIGAPLQGIISTWPHVYLSKSDGVHYDSRVAQLQQRLLNRKWNIVVDGWFGRGTDTVVREFQTEKGLISDGVVGPLTWDAIFSTTNVT